MDTICPICKPSERMAAMLADSSGANCMPALRDAGLIKPKLKPMRSTVVKTQTQLVMPNRGLSERRTNATTSIIEPMYMGSRYPVRRRYMLIITDIATDANPSPTSSVLECNSLMPYRLTAQRGISERPPMAMPVCIKFTRFTAPKPLPYIKRGLIKGNFTRLICLKNRVNDIIDATMRG